MEMEMWRATWRRVSWCSAFLSERDVVHKQGARQWFAEPCPPSTQPGIWYFQSVKDFVTGLERTWCQTVKYFIFYVKDYVSCNERWMMISRIFCGTKRQYKRRMLWKIKCTSFCWNVTCGHCQTRSNDVTLVAEDTKFAQDAWFCCR